MEYAELAVEDDATATLLCSICFLIASDPREASCCGHLACSGCEEEYLRKRAQACFHCRSDGYTSSRISQGFRRVFANTEVRCQLCGECMKYDMFAAHMDLTYNYQKPPRQNACPGLERPCPNAGRGCDFRGPLAVMRAHLTQDCTKGYRELDNEAIRLCGGKERLARNVDIVKHFLGLASGGSTARGPPLEPKLLEEQLDSAQVQLTVPEFFELCGADGVPGGVLQEVLESAVPDADAEAKQHLLMDYHNALKNRVVDAWNLKGPAQREAPQAIRRRGVKRRKLADGQSELLVTADEAWRAVFFEELPAETLPPSPSGALCWRLHIKGHCRYGSRCRLEH